MPTTFILNENEDGYLSGRYENNNNRLIQYKNNLLKFIEYKLSNNFDLILSDNSAISLEDKNFINLLENNNIKCFFGSTNNYGGVNKGAGVLENYISKYEILKNYEYILHFEPRQILMSSNFFKTFLSKPFNLFKYSEWDWRNILRGKSFYTGLFSIKSSLWFKFINEINLIHITKKGISIEYELYKFFKKNKIEHKIIHKLDLCWHDTYRNNDRYY